MKDQLLDRPATIGDLRRQGVVTLEVRCRLPCRRVGRVPLDALRLPDDAEVAKIPTLRPGLSCSECDRRVATVAPVFPVAEPPKVGETASARWIVATTEPDGTELVSSPLWSSTEARSFAARQIEEGRGIARIETPTGTIGAGDVAAWLADR